MVRTAQYYIYVLILDGKGEIRVRGIGTLKFAGTHFF